MTSFRWLRSAVAASWAACRSAIDLEDCLIVAGYVLLAVGSWQIYQPLGYLVPGGLIVLPRIIRSLQPRVVKPQPRERKWAA
jgi:hypothetical protein